VFSGDLSKGGFTPFPSGARFGRILRSDSRVRGSEIETRRELVRSCLRLAGVFELVPSHDLACCGGCRDGLSDSIVGTGVEEEQTVGLSVEILTTGPVSVWSKTALDKGVCSRLILSICMGISNRAI
jgi:hypothetical protein